MNILAYYSEDDEQGVSTRLTILYDYDHRAASIHKCRGLFQCAAYP